MQRKKYMCGMCKWKFARNYTPMLCPYCGKAAVVIAEEEQQALKVKH